MLWSLKATLFYRAHNGAAPHWSTPATPRVCDTVHVVTKMGKKIISKSSFGADETPTYCPWRLRGSIEPVRSQSDRSVAARSRRHWRLPLPCGKYQWRRIASSCALARCPQITVTERKQWTVSNEVILQHQQTSAWLAWRWWYSTAMAKHLRCSWRADNCWMFCEISSQDLKKWDVGFNCTNPKSVYSCMMYLSAPVSADAPEGVYCNKVPLYPIAENKIGSLDRSFPFKDGITSMSPPAPAVLPISLAENDDIVNAAPSFLVTVTVADPTFVPVRACAVTPVYTTGHL